MYISSADLNVVWVSGANLNGLGEGRHRGAYILIRHGVSGDSEPVVGKALRARAMGGPPAVNRVTPGTASSCGRGMGPEKPAFRFSSANPGEHHLMERCYAMKPGHTL